MSRYDSNRADTTGRRGGGGDDDRARHHGAGEKAIPARRPVSHTVGPCWEAISHLQLRKRPGGAGKLQKTKSPDGTAAASPDPSKCRSKEAAQGHVETLFQREAQRRERLEAKRVLRQQQLIGDRFPAARPHLLVPLSHGGHSQRRRRSIWHRRCTRAAESRSPKMSRESRPGSHAIKSGCRSRSRSRSRSPSPSQHAIGRSCLAKPSSVSLADCAARAFGPTVSRVPGRSHSP